MLTTLAAPQDLPTKFDAAFGVALSRLQARYATRPVSKQEPESVISGCETDGTDAQDNQPRNEE